MKKVNNSIIITLIISGVVLLIAILALFIFQSFSPSKNVLTVEGVSTVKATPNLITVYFNIETKGKTSAEAKDANTKILDNFKGKLIAQGFKEEDIKTENYNIYPNIYWENGKQKEDGFIAAHSVKIELSIEQLNKLTSVIDAGVNAGAGVSSINFELTQEAQNTYKAQALKLAAEDAQTKANSVASGFDKKAGKLISVQVSDFGYYPWNLYSSAGASRTEDAAIAKEAVMNIQPGEKEISARVSATFQLQ